MHSSSWVPNAGSTPRENEPGTGEIDYAYLLPKIDELGYDGWVGLEYKPTRPTVETLDWLEAFA